MNAWTRTTQCLPANRDAVQFLVAGRQAWLSGTFEDACFRSRWAQYLASEVTVWRRPNVETRSRTRQRDTDDTQYWIERGMRGR